MGELVVSSGGGMEIEVQETEQAGHGGDSAAPATAADMAGTSSSCAVKWERFLPKMAMRVLLVENDDSTRQIIAALLRKCSYRVAAVCDGLKAWELLKGRSHNIDLILTEVELPSISGYALLTLIMEHDVCKNIPVIMMSSNDSVSTVYKCMLRGAADFLVKPLRKNELRNLWQHVWRRQASSGGAGPGPPDESEPQQKVEATAENNGTSNHSSGYMACIQRNRECIEKGSDAQSSCTKPELENGGADAEHIHCLSEQKPDKCLSHDINVSTQEKCHQENIETQANDNETGESRAVASLDANALGQVRVGQNPENDNVLENPSREAIDLIGAFDTYLKGNFGNSATNASTNKLDIMPQLSLSLKRSHPSVSVNQVNDESRRLKLSDASAFSRYIYKPLQKEHETNSEKQFSNHTPDYNSDTHGQTISQKHISESTVWPVFTFPYPQQRELSHPIPQRHENIINGYDSLVPRIYCAQSGPSTVPTPVLASQSEPFAQLNLFYPSDARSEIPHQPHNLIDQTDNKKCGKSENFEDRGYISSANDQTGNSSFYSGSMGHYQSNEEGFCVHEGAPNRSSQREAALNKFRLKRKGRCFDKKVRYESRKKLAEQRPRIKGQFVRQATNDPQLENPSSG